MSRLTPACTTTLSKSSTALARASSSPLVSVPAAHSCCSAPRKHAPSLMAGTIASLTISSSWLFLSSRTASSPARATPRSRKSRKPRIPFFAISWNLSPFPCERPAKYRATLGKGRPLRRACLLSLHHRARRRAPAGAVFRRRCGTRPDRAGHHFGSRRAGHRRLGRSDAGSHPGEAHAAPLDRLQHAIPDHLPGLDLL